MSKTGWAESQYGVTHYYWKDGQYRAGRTVSSWAEVPASDDVRGRAAQLPHERFENLEAMDRHRVDDKHPGGFADLERRSRRLHG